jgi:hypothetical protein
MPKQHPEPIWEPEPEFFSATTAAHAFVGAYELVAFDLPPNGSYGREIDWEIYSGPKLLDLVETGKAPSFEDAKKAAEEAWRKLI